MSDEYCPWGDNIDKIEERFANTERSKILRMICDGTYSNGDSFWCLEDNAINGYYSAQGMLCDNYENFFYAVKYFLEHKDEYDEEGTKLYEWKRILESKEFAKNKERLNKLVNDSARVYKINLICFHGKLQAKYLFDYTTSTLNVHAIFGKPQLDKSELSLITNTIKFVDKLNRANFKLWGVD